MEKIPVMAHLVLGYPGLQESLQSAETYIAAGVQTLELQIPFSHPTADGPVITAACQEAVRQGVSVRDCLEAIATLRARHPRQEIMVMSYANRLFAYGFQAFAAKMAELGIRHLIVPDWPADQPWPGFEGAKSSVKLVPVLAANTPEHRVQALQQEGFDFYYLMSDFKITGSGFSLHPRLQQMVEQLKTKPCRVGIGFGIASPEQVRTVAAVADLAIVGSALIQAQKEGKLAEYLESLRAVFYAEPVFT
jgi:tryptophan synthase alpha chain